MARGERWGLALLLVTFVGMALVYDRAIPLYEGPDEVAHLEYIDYLLDAKQLPPFDAATARISHQLVQQPPLFYVIGAVAVAWAPVDEALAYAEINPYINKNKSHRAYITLPDAPATSAVAPRVARLVSLLGAALAVWGTWLLARRLLPMWPWAAYVAAAVVGFNPQFLFSAATITNDTWAAALPVWALWLALGAEDVAHPWRVWLGAGALVGAAALVKYSALAVVAPLGVVGLAQVYRMGAATGWRNGRWWVHGVVRQGGAAAVGFVVVAGWWLARNVMVAGAILPLARMVELQPAMAWPMQRAWDDPALWAAVRWLLRSYWGVFGYGIIAPAWYHGVVQNMLLVALAGYAMWGVRAVVGGRQGIVWPRWLWLTGLWGMGVAVIWLALAFGTLLNWMRVMQFTDQGRLLFPAAPAIALLIVVGWAAWVPQRVQLWGALVAVGLMVGLGASQMATLRAYYALPPKLEEPLAMDRAIEARFEAGMMLLGMDLPEGAAVDAGGTMPLTLYWATDAIIPANYTLFVHLADAENRLLYQFDGVPYGGRHPTRQWRPGERFADSYLLTVARHDVDAEEDSLATLSVGFYPVEELRQRQPVHALASGELLGDRLTVATVRVHAQPRPESPASLTPAARWQQGIVLDAFAVARDDAGMPEAVTLRWRATQPVHTDYTVFVQLLDVENQVLGQMDRQPHAGAWPTSTWRTGDVVEETIALPLSAEISATVARQEWATLIVGLYALGGEVLDVTEPAPQDYFTLMRREPR